MVFNLSKFRKNYKKNILIESESPKNPFYLFHDWFQYEKSIKKEEEINAMSLSTLGKNGFPETRIVLLKEYSEKGFVFYTNYYSSKGKSIFSIPKVCISFFWKKTERQIIIKGIASKLSRKKSDQYFNNRPKGNKIGSWSSKQSTVIKSRNFLIKQYKKWSSFFRKKIITRPFYWGGYIVKPYTIEFWQGRPNRLHDRIIYIRKENKWNLKRLSP